jgi:hypothetical protein
VGSPAARRYPHARTGLQRRAAIGLLALSLLLAGCEAGGTAASDPAPEASLQSAGTPAAAPGISEFLVGGQRAVLWTPRHSNGRLVTYVHGYGGTARSIVDGPSEYLTRLVSGLVAAGYTVVSSDAHGDAWGSEDSVADYRRLIADARDRTGTTAVYVLTESMGGLAGAELVSEDPPEGLRAYAGIFPVCDLVSVYPRYQQQIEAVYRERTTEAVVDRSPVPLRTDVPVLMWASPTDTVVPKSVNADTCAAEAQAAGSRARVVSTVGDHGDASNYDLAALLVFFESAAPD